MCIRTGPDVTNKDSKEASTGITEAVLAAVWNEQSPLRGPMWDCEGNPVAVLYRGRWTAGSGPDFEGAMLSMGEAETLVNGSVEMHLRCADWFAHGHHTDPRYNNVALHVVLWPHSARPVTRQDGKVVPTLVLADYITLSAAELVDHAERLVPNLGTLSEEPCWQRTAGWPVERLLAPIDQAGTNRLMSKAAVMEAEIEVTGSPDEVFYRGLMDSLGYSANREPMRALANALPLSTLLTLPLAGKPEERTEILESVLLGAGGLLPSQRAHMSDPDFLSAQYAEAAERLWKAYSRLMGLEGEVAASGWQTNRVRPANSPPRRLAAGAFLLARLLWQEGGMLGPFRRAAGRGLTPEALASEWTSLLCVPARGYWAQHTDFGKPLSGAGKESALIGEGRASDMVVNVLLPLVLASAEREGDETLYDQVLAVYAVYPRLEENRITRAMADEAFGPRKAGLIKSARRQQGLIHLYKLYCEARRCYECPLSGMRVPD